MVRPELQTTTPYTQSPLFEMGELPIPYPDSYSLITGHLDTLGREKSTEEIHREYVTRTDEVIQDLLDKRADISVSDDTVVFLDKSARPVAWLMKELWPILAKQEDGTVPPLPDIKFVNIDRNQWSTYLDQHNTGNVAVEQIDDSIIRSLRAPFIRNLNKIKNSQGNALVTEEVDKEPTYFDDRRVLIVDEVRSSGRTLDYAKRFFKRAFPEARKIDGTHWMGETVVIDGATGNADIPVWYSDKTDYGRGVGNRNIDLSKKSKNTAQKLGAWFLSVAHPSSDPASIQLREEIKQLAKDVEAGNIFVQPSNNHKFDERVVSLNKNYGISSLDDAYTVLRKFTEERRASGR